MSIGLCSTPDVITFDQNWHYLYSNSEGGKDLLNDTQIRGVLLKAGPAARGPRPTTARRPDGPAARRPSPDFPPFFCPAVNSRACTDLHRVWACKMDDGQFEFVNHLNPCFCLLHVVEIKTFSFSVHSSLYRNR